MRLKSSKYLYSEYSWASAQKRDVWMSNTLTYSQTGSSVFPKNQDLVLLFKIWIHSSFELLKFKSSNGLLESSLDLNNQIWLEYRTIVVVSWTLEDVTKCVWPCFRTWKASLDLYSSARKDYISFQRRFFRKRKLQTSCGDESFCW